MLQPSRPDHVRDWLKALSLCVKHNDDSDAAALRSMAYVGLLLKDAPVEAFCEESLHFIAGKNEWMPEYMRLRDDIKEFWWRKTNPERVKALEQAQRGPQDRVEIPARREPPTEQEIALVGDIVENFRMELKDRRAAQDALNPPPDRPQARLLSDTALLREYEKLGRMGEVRAAMLRKKLSLPDLDPDAQDQPRPVRPKPYEPFPLPASPYRLWTGDEADYDDPPMRSMEAPLPE